MIQKNFRFKLLFFALCLAQSFTNFLVQKVYNLADKTVIFDRMSFQNYSSSEEALTKVVNKELAKEKQMEENAKTAVQILKDHASKLLPAY